MRAKQRQQGFTLLEMGIVLVIIALVAAGIVTGRSMIQQSTKRAVIAEIDKNLKALHMFSDKFHSLPGDFDEAQSYWGADSGCPGTAFNDTPKQATCDGDGDGMIGNFDGATYTNTQEWYRAWQHLANAGFVDGQFTGVGDNVAQSQLLNISIPKSQYNGGGYTLHYTFNEVIDTEEYAINAGHVMEFGAVDPDCALGSTMFNCITHSPLMPPSDALEIDQKIDDGRPGTGVVLARPQGSLLNPSCTDQNSGVAPQIALYDLSGTDRRCALIISTGF